MLLNEAGDFKSSYIFNLVVEKVSEFYQVSGAAPRSQHVVVVTGGCAERAAGKWWCG